MIHTDRSCMLKCSCCNRIFCLEDTFQVAQIKNPGVQNPCLENATDLTGPNLCLCVGCYQATKKPTSSKNRSKRHCIIMNCDQTACHIFDSKLKDELNTFLMDKVKFRVLNNEEEALHKICFCNAHYDQVLLITQCELCGNRSMHKYQLHEDNVSEYQLILDEDNIPVTIKYGILICNPCHVYILLRRDKTTIITCELKKLIDASKTRIINKNILKTKGLERIQLAKNEINMNKKEENNQLLTVTSLPTNRSNFSTADFSMPSKTVSSVLALNTITTPPLLVNSTATLMQSVTTVLTTTIGTALATDKASLTTITQPIVKTPVTTLTKATEDMKLIVKIGKLTALTLKRKRQPTFLDENSSVPRTKKYVVSRLTVSTDCKNHTIRDHKPTLPVQKSTVPGVELTNPVDNPIISIHKPSFQVVKPTANVDKSMIPDHKRLYNKSLVFSSILRPIFSSKWPVPKKHKKTLESVSTAKKPTQLQTNLSIQNTLDLRSTLPRTKLPELSCQRTGTTILSSATLDMIQEIKVPIDKLTVSDHKPLYNKSIIFSPVLKPFFSSKSTVLKKREKPPESVSPIREPKQLQTNQSYQNILEEWSTSSRTEVPKLNCQRVSPTTLPPVTPDMNQLVENLNISVDEPTITDRKPLGNEPVFSPVVRPFLSSKFTVLEKNGKSPESVSPIKEPTQLQTNKSYQNTLDSRSILSRTEFPELSHKGASSTPLSSTTPDMIQLFENLKTPYPNGIAFINHLLNLETCRNLGTLIVGNNKTTYRQRTSNTATTSNHNLQRSPKHEEY
ncbi:zonadhesin-like [Myzus persicae]|uniref:zonadhesin-like n=1 Tax=Myzus persicae TaxID=13164 RepID=UPI000B932F87|nr:zonadhesin-like [Myzus persicae]